MSAAAVLVVVVLGGQLPSPLYAVYAEALGLTATAITVLFAVYAAGVLLALLSFGHLSDHVGRRVVLVAAIALSALSDLTFVLGVDAYPALLVGRVLSGFSIGLLSGAAAALLTELARPTGSSGGGTAGTATVVGGGCGALLAGAVAQWTSAATTVVYLAHLAMLGVAVLFLLAIPETVAHRRRTRPRLPWPALGELGGRAFLSSALAPFCGFAVLGLVSALVGTFLRDLGHPSHLLAGALPFGMAVTAVVGPALAPSWTPTTLVRVGLAGLVPCLALLAVGVASGSLLAVVVAVVAVGAPFGLAFQGALRASREPPGSRPGARYSALFAAAYAGMALPVIGAGALADDLTPTATVAIFGAVVGALAIGGALSASA